MAIDEKWWVVVDRESRRTFKLVASSKKLWQPGSKRCVGTAGSCPPRAALRSFNLVHHPGRNRNLSKQDKIHHMPIISSVL